MADPKTPTTPSAEPVAEAPKTVKIDLRNPIRISNVKNTWEFPAGRGIEVPADMAEDVKRIDDDHQDYKANLLIKRTSTVDAGTFAVGGSE